MFGSLPPPPRRYLPASVRLDRLADLEACYGELGARPLPADDPWTLEQWLRDWSELESHLSEAQARRQIASSCSADDLEAARAWLVHVDVLGPACKPLRHALARRLVEHPAAARLPPGHACALAVLRNRVDLWRPGLAPLEVAEQHLCAEYGRLRAGMRAAWDGADAPLTHVERSEDDPDRGRRETAWRTVAASFRAAKPELDHLFDRLLANRRAQAATAELPDYRAYRFRRLDRLAYGPRECLALHDAIAAEFVPLAGRVLRRRAAALGLPALRPWDLAVMPGGPLAPFTREEQLIAGCTRAFEAVDPELARQFSVLAEHGLLDLMSRPGKAPGAFQVHLDASALPFVFAGAVGRHEDLLTVLHEAGHAFHALACAADPLIWNRGPPIEFCEVASMGMELLGGRHLGAFYDADACTCAARHQLEQLVLFLPHAAAIDAFQHWVYTRPEQARDPQARDAAWLAQHRRLCPGVDWSGLDDDRAALWQRRLHVFELPFYYIEYAIAGLGAVQLHRRALAEPAPAVADLRRALALGARARLPDLFAAAGLHFGTDRSSVRRAADACRQLLDL
ncbi:M3 family oligoendopeptidase [Nannocystis radixulma]|uniref:M3 family oligoendopeptidase n=1 Tax=Nannocystis radixulma TaxID=2995305 RepID=A0ABT5BIE4_9BACT|nr:M3 family oligoendopeptidase [Nannocystis radixulma]MDC0673903.1 M3 family oligoendopeptidase [Nannocystis radixulma]